MGFTPSFSKNNGMWLGILSWNLSKELLGIEFFRKGLGTKWAIGGGQEVNFWSDTWADAGPLRSAEFQALLSSTAIRTTYSVNIAWTSLPPGWMKLNTDRSASGNLGRAGAGGILRNELGRWIRGFALFLGTTNSLVAELWAIHEGLVMAKSLGIRSLWVELDAKVVMELIWGSSQDNLLLKSLIDDCRELRRHFREVRVQHVYREGNKVTDALAWIGRDTGQDLMYFDIAPSDVAALLTYDAMGMSSPRFVRDHTTNMVGD
ncbi:hypothetical protein CRG98_022277 [Punica granatum]|uniref:RNase H type-1 domain-containing protein n=1 Tax=Punica granatum TaxID=22663 RepID=A0A2I0JM15_PUNGR|nr:hypothetical protein CRG98_022277 [Punica granatum]